MTNEEISRKFMYIASCSDRIAEYSKTNAPLVFLECELTRLEKLLEDVKPWIEEKRKQHKDLHEKYPELFNKQT